MYINFKYLNEKIFLNINFFDRIKNKLKQIKKKSEILLIVFKKKIFNKI